MCLQEADLINFSHKIYTVQDLPDLIFEIYSLYLRVEGKCT